MSDAVVLWTGLVIPGGESTVMGVFLQKNGFLDVIKQFSHDKCVMGTCAGLILLADNIQGGRAGGSSWVRCITKGFTVQSLGNDNGSHATGGRSCRDGISQPLWPTIE
jgi:putative intracellular protease/amidase